MISDMWGDIERLISQSQQALSASGYACFMEENDLYVGSSLPPQNLMDKIFGTGLDYYRTKGWNGTLVTTCRRGTELLVMGDKNIAVVLDEHFKNIRIAFYP